MDFSFDKHFDAFQLDQEFIAAGPLNTFRKNSFSIFKEHGLPSAQAEEWRFTPVSMFKRTDHSIETLNDPAPVSDGFIQKKRLNDTHMIVLRLGQIDPQISDTKGLPENITLLPLIKALESTPGLLSRMEKQPPAPGQEGLKNLNLAFLNNGLYLKIPDGVILDKPLHIFYENSANGASALTHPHIIIDMGIQSEALIIEEFSSEKDQARWVNPSTDLYLGSGSNLTHIVLNNETKNTIQTSRLNVFADENSHYAGHNFNTGGSLIRQDSYINLRGEGSSSVYNALNLLDETKHCNFYSWMSHEAPNTVSSQIVKMILKDTSQGVFNGRVIVHPDAQKTDAQQSNRNLLVSPKAIVHSNPQLEINADDVKCSHGSTTGELDEEALFYMQTRGIDRQNAQALLMEGFARELLDALPLRSLKDRLEIKLNKWLSNAGDTNV